MVELSTHWCEQFKVHSLQIKDVASGICQDDIESIGGFVGNDFYRTTLESIKTQLPEYFELLEEVKLQITPKDILQAVKK